MSKAPGSRGGGKHTDKPSPKTSSKDKRESGTSPREDATAQERSRHIDALLDAALEATFPASDPCQMCQKGLPGSPAIARLKRAVT